MQVTVPTNRKKIKIIKLDNYYKRVHRTFGISVELNQLPEYFRSLINPEKHDGKS